MFVTKPFNSWVNKSQKMNSHAKQDCHLTSTTKMNEFLTRFEHPSEAINIKFDNEARKRMEDNQTVTESLLKVVMLCGKDLPSVVIEMIKFGLNRKSKRQEIKVTSLSWFVSELKQMMCFEDILKVLPRMLATLLKQFKMN